jgi:hypothetical protein
VRNDDQKRGNENDFVPRENMGYCHTAPLLSPPLHRHLQTYLAVVMMEKGFVQLVQQWHQEGPIQGYKWVNIFIQVMALVFRIESFDSL